MTRRNRPPTDQETLGGRSDIGEGDVDVEKFQITEVIAEEKVEEVVSDERLVEAIQEELEDLDIDVGEQHPVRASIGADSRVGSRFQDFQGNFVPLPDLPVGVEENAVVEDPKDGVRRVVSIAGADENLDAVSIVQCFNIDDMSWSTNVYPDLPEARQNSGYATSDDKIFIIGGENSDGDATNTIYELDVTDDEPEWVEWEETLDYSVDRYPFTFTHNGELFVIGGNDNDSDVRGEVSVFDIESRSFIEYREPHPLYEGEGSDTGVSDGYGDVPIVDGKAYFAGYSDDGEEFEDTRFYSYNIEEDSWERLADVEGLLYEGDEETSAGFGWGNLREYRGNLVYIDGYMYHNEQDVAYYSIEDDEWVGRGIDGVDNMSDLEFRDGVVPWWGNNRGPLIDGVIWMPGTNNSQECLWAYTPEGNPFGGE